MLLSVALSLSIGGVVALASGDLTAAAVGTTVGIAMAGMLSRAPRDGEADR